MRGRLPLFAAALCAVLAPAGALAAVGGSPHDLIAQGYDVTKGPETRGPCTPCHVSMGKEKKNFLKEVPPSLRRYDAASLACFSCHDGTTLVNENIDASTTAFHPASHGYDLQNYGDLVPDDGSLPFREGIKMSCITCHDPHDNSNRPFLRAPLAGLCQQCHGNLADGEGRAAPGHHPMLRDFPEGGTKSAPIEVVDAFRVPFPASYPMGAGRTAEGVHWDLGGHMTGGDTGQLSCFTCHAVHGDEVEPPLAMLLALDPVRERADEFCEGCHRGERGDGLPGPPWPNPGGTSTARTYHPADDDGSGGSGTLLETVPPPDWPRGTAPSTPLLCTTCHRAHDTDEATPLLRRSDSEDFCGACHKTMPLPHHHPVTALRCTANLPGPLYGGAEGKMYCSTCHRAHNAGLDGEDETLHVPLLRDQWADGAICESCHPADNPTCAADPLYRASHFLGDPTLPETYEDSNPPIRTEDWPESGLPSLYGDLHGKTITCLSCHTFKAGSVISGDDGVSGHLLAQAGNRVEWDEGEEGNYLCTGCHSANPSTAGSGSSHPYMNADAEKLGRTVDLPATITPNGHVNCDSCHRTHEALTSSGTYMLEDVTSDNKDPLMIHPKIDYTVLCHKCHDPTKY